MCKITCQKQEYILHFFMNEKMDHQYAAKSGDGEDGQRDHMRRVTTQETSGQQGRNTIYFPELGLTLPDMGVQVNVSNAQNAEDENLDQLRACANTLEGNPPVSDQGSRGLSDRLLRMEVELDRLKRRSSTRSHRSRRSEYTMSPTRSHRRSECTRSPAPPPRFSNSHRSRSQSLDTDFEEGEIRRKDRSSRSHHRRDSGRTPSSSRGVRPSKRRLTSPHGVSRSRSSSLSTRATSPLSGVNPRQKKRVKSPLYGVSPHIHSPTKTYSVKDKDFKGKIHEFTHKDEKLGPPVSEWIVNETKNYLSVDRPEACQEFVEKYRRPKNCPSLVVPEDNPELLKKLHKPHEEKAKKLRVCQTWAVTNLIATSQLLDVMDRAIDDKRKIDPKEVASTLGDMLCLNMSMASKINNLRMDLYQDVLPFAVEGLCGKKESTLSAKTEEESDYRYLFGTGITQKIKDLKEVEKFNQILSSKNGEWGPSRNRRDRAPRQHRQRQQQQRQQGGRQQGRPYPAPRRGNHRQSIVNPNVPKSNIFHLLRNNKENRRNFPQKR